MSTQLSTEKHRTIYEQKREDLSKNEKKKEVRNDLNEDKRIMQCAYHDAQFTQTLIYGALYTIRFTCINKAITTRMR